MSVGKRGEVSYESSIKQTYLTNLSAEVKAQAIATSFRQLIRLRVQQSAYLSELLTESKESFFPCGAKMWCLMACSHLLNACHRTGYSRPKSHFPMKDPERSKAASSKSRCGGCTPGVGPASSGPGGVTGQTGGNKSVPAIFGDVIRHCYCWYGNSARKIIPRCNQANQPR